MLCLHAGCVVPTCHLWGEESQMLPNWRDRGSLASTDLLTNHAFWYYTRLPGKGNAHSNDARPVYSTIRWIQTSRLSIKNLSLVIYLFCGHSPGSNLSGSVFTRVTPPETRASTFAEVHFRCCQLSMELTFMGCTCRRSPSSWSPTSPGFTCPRQRYLRTERSPSTWRPSPSAAPR